MASILVGYATGEGQTANVADRLVETLDERGHEADAVDVASLPDGLDVASYDAVVVGASIHMGTHADSVREFVTDRREALAARPTAFFQVSLSSAVDDSERRAEAAGYVDDFLEATDWRPDRLGLFGDALRYSKYGFLKRLMMKRIAADATGDTDTSRDYEYTDWVGGRCVRRGLRGVRRGAPRGGTSRRRRGVMWRDAGHRRLARGCPRRRRHHVLRTQTARTPDASLRDVNASCTVIFA